MRFSIGATAILAAAVVRADEEASSSASESSTSTSIVKPTFTVSCPYSNASMAQIY